MTDILSTSRVSHVRARQSSVCVRALIICDCPCPSLSFSLLCVFFFYAALLLRSVRGLQLTPISGGTNGIGGFSRTSILGSNVLQYGHLCSDSMRHGQNGHGLGTATVMSLSRSSSPSPSRSRSWRQTRSRLRSLPQPRSRPRSRGHGHDPGHSK